MSDQNTVTKTGKTVKVGVLGYGFVREIFHLPCYSGIPNAEAVAIVGRSKEKATRVAEKFGVEKVYSGGKFLQALCSDQDVEVVDIGLPNFLHKEATEIAAENGKHVICEKPLARTIEEARSALKAVERHGVIDCYAENQVFLSSRDESEEDDCGRLERKCPLDKKQGNTLRSALTLVLGP